MNAVNTESLVDATISALERTAMVLAEPAEDTDGYGSVSRYARVAYSGPSHGTLTLCANDQFMCDLAASLLGVEPSEIDVDDQGVDALKEMANILGGSVIVAISGESCDYSLGLPEILADAGTSAAEEATANAKCVVTADDGLLQVLWTHAA